MLVALLAVLIGVGLNPRSPSGGPIRWRPVVIPIFLLLALREAWQGEDCND
jgi:hypothetical protein